MAGIPEHTTLALSGRRAAINEDSKEKGKAEEAKIAR
jgi:hypothetical protein